MNERHAAEPGRAHRYAAYFAPPVESDWWEAGSRWLGRCAASGRTWPQSDIDGVPPEQLRRLMAAPRRYGWHATLTAPFTLRPQIEASGLRAGLRELQHI